MINAPITLISGSTKATVADTGKRITAPVSTDKLTTEVTVEYQQTSISAEVDIATREVITVPVSSVSTGTQGGFVFVTGVTSTGNVGEVVFVPDTVPDDAVVLSCTVDADTAVVHFIAEGWNIYSPRVYVDGILCTNMIQSAQDVRLFTGSVEVDVAESKSISIYSNTGSRASVQINKATAGPSITEVHFLEDYPAGQTEVKALDSCTLRVTFDAVGSQPTEVYVDNFGACVGRTQSLDLNWPVVNYIDLTVTICSTGSVAQSLGARVSARNALGTLSEEVISDNTMLCNDIVPTFVDLGTGYPTGQGAFKGVETGIQSTGINDYTSVTYSSPTSEFLINDPGVAETIKTIICLDPGTYNDSIPNFRIVAVRSTNGTVSTFQKVIEVADVAPVITVTQVTTRLRSSASGTDHVITATSNQKLASAPSLSVPVSGTWQGSGFSGGPKVYSRSIRIADGAVSGSGAYILTSIPENKAGIQATVQGSQVVGGFVSRQLTLPAFGTQVSTGARVTTTSKLSLTWSFKSGMTYKAIGTAAPDANGWTIDAVNASPTQIIVLDTAAAMASSQASTLTIEEAV